MSPEQICPGEIGQAVFALALEQPTQKLRAHQPIAISIDASKAGDLGLLLPIEIRVTSGSSKDSYRRIIHRRVVPSRFVFFPVESGPHVVRVAEVYHQRYVGTLQLEVEGERLDATTL